MKNSISLYAIAIVMAISTVVHAQHRAPAVPFVDTIQYGNTVLIRSSIYSQAIPIPYEGADPKEVYRAAKSGKKLVTVKERIMFNLHSMQTVTEYVYENNSWKPLTTVTDVGVQKYTGFYWGIITLFYFLTHFFFIKLSVSKEGYFIGIIYSFIAFLFSVIGSLYFLEKIVLNKLIHSFNQNHLTILFILWLLVPFITKIKIRKNKKDVIVEPSPQ